MTIELSVKWVTLPKQGLWKKFYLISLNEKVWLNARRLTAFLINHDRWLLFPFFLLAFGIVTLCVL